jgi:hypothetical protein
LSKEAIEVDTSPGTPVAFFSIPLAAAHPLSSP